MTIPAQPDPGSRHDCTVERWMDPDLPIIPKIGTVWHCRCGKVYEYRNERDETGHVRPGFRLVPESRPRPAVESGPVVGRRPLPIGRLLLIVVAVFVVVLVALLAV